MRRCLGSACAVLLLGIGSGSAFAQGAGAAGEWRAYAGDERGLRYSPLDQIDGDNVDRLEIAWTWKSDNFGSPEFRSQTTPLMVGGRLFFTAGNRRNVVAVDAGTGETL